MSDPAERPRPCTDFSARRARQLWEEGRAHHLTGDVDGALVLYDRSLQLHPTAEAYAYRGWGHSLRGRFEAAIADCRCAIALDPDLGNPYNDVGSYLVALGREAEAVLWFERAKRAPRYHPRHYPYMNLARLYASRGEIARALTELEGALALRPAEPTCLLLRERFRRWMHGRHACIPRRDVMPVGIRGESDGPRPPQPCSSEP